MALTWPTMIPLYVTGERIANPPAFLKSAVTLQVLAPIRTPLNQSKVPAKATTAPIMEKPTIASRTLRRMI